MPRIPLHRRLLYTVFTVVMFTAAAEGVSRLVWSAPDVVINPSLAYLVDHPTLFWTMRPGLEGYVTPDGFTLTTNSLGLRDDEIRHPLPSTRILSMGESTTWGHGVEAEQTYSELLQAKLIEGGTDAEVINAGIGAWTTWQSYVFLLEHGAELSPDAVMIYHLHNDQLPRGVVDANNFLYQVRYPDPELYELRLPWRHLLTLLYRSRLYLRIRMSVLALPSELPEAASMTVLEQARVPMEDRKRALAGIAEICQDIGARLVVLMPVYRRHPGRDHVLSDFAQQNRTLFINLPSKQRESGVDEQAFFLDAIHPSVQGHAMIADWIHEDIAGEPWIR